MHRNIAVTEVLTARSVVASRLDVAQEQQLPGAKCALQRCWLGRLPAFNYVKVEQREHVGALGRYDASFCTRRWERCYFVVDHDGFRTAAVPEEEEAAGESHPSLPPFQQRQVKILRHTKNVESTCSAALKGDFREA